MILYDKIDNTRINPISKQRFFKGENNDCVLLIHGYTGTPHDLNYLGRRLNKAGYSVFIPRLPGHGTNTNDFLNSTWKDWLKTAVESYLNLVNNYNNLYVVGLSMGGVIASLLAANFKIDKLVLAAPALDVINKKMKYTPYIKYFVKSLKREKIDEYQDKNLQILRDNYWTYDYPPKIADLYKLIKMANKNLHKINSNTLVILSKMDWAVPISVKEIIENNIPGKKEFLIFEDSHHVVVNDVRKEEAADKIISFLNS